MNWNKKTIAIFFGGLALAVLALVLGVNFLLKLVPVEEKPPSIILPAPEVNVNLQPPAPSREPAFQIQKDAVDQRPVVYTAAGFKPKSVTIKTEDAIGCLITVINQSQEILRVGVNPHSPEGDPGADYGVLQPGETGILDVRYSGFTEITLHNHRNPNNEFKVVYGEGCQ